MSDLTVVLVGAAGAVGGFVLKEVWGFFFRREAVTQKECEDRRDQCAGHINDDLERGSTEFGDIKAELGDIRQAVASMGLVLLLVCKDKGEVCDDLRKKITELARGH